MRFHFDAEAFFEAKDITDACKKISEQFARMAEEDWKKEDPTTDGIFKDGHVDLNAAITGLNKL